MQTKACLIGFGGPNNPLLFSINSIFLGMGGGFFLSLSAFFLMLAKTTFRLRSRVPLRALSNILLVWKRAEG